MTQKEGKSVFLVLPEEYKHDSEKTAKIVALLIKNNYVVSLSNLNGQRPVDDHLLSGALLELEVNHARQTTIFDFYGIHTYVWQTDSMSGPSDLPRDRILINFTTRRDKGQEIIVKDFFPDKSELAKSVIADIKKIVAQVLA